MMNEDALQFISVLKPFSFLPSEDLAQIAEVISEFHYPENTVLSTQGKTDVDKIFIIREGALELYYDIEGKKILSGYLKKGQVCGGIASLMNGGIAVRSVRVHEDALLYAFPRALFLDICSRHRRFREFFTNIYSKLMLDESYASIMAAGRAPYFLSRLEPFSFLPEAEIEKISSFVSVAHFPKNKVLFIQNRSRLDYLYIIYKGAAERYFEEEGQKKLKGFMGEGDIYGGISMLLNDGISVRTLLIKEKTYFYILPGKVFLDICKRYKSFSDFFTDAFGERMLNRSYASIIARSRQSKDPSLDFFSQPISTFYTRDPIYCNEDMPIREAAELMCQNLCSSLLVKSSDGKFSGIVTDNDLRKKVVSMGHDISKPVSEIMTSPVETISDGALVFESLISMMKKNIKHLAVADPSGNILGVVTNRDLLTAQSQSPLFLIREIGGAKNRNNLVGKHDQLPMMIKGMIQRGAKPENITRLITTFSDAVLETLFQFALADFGPPPTPFAFLILGSEGRREQTLKTDQDNAIIYEDVPDSMQSETEEYFKKFGENICDWLDKAGFDFCKGNIMAKNPKWCQPVSVWKEYFSSWIHTAEAEDLLQASIFFDFRFGAGNKEIADKLKTFLFDALHGWSGFFRHLTENALHFKPPIGFFRNFVVESKGEHRDKFDIKGAMQPIVDFARIYALFRGVRETNTQERLRQLYLQNILADKDYHDLEQSYAFLMQLRFVRQLTAIIDEGNEKADNYINPKKLSRIEQKMLKEIFARIERFQTKLSFDFLGIA